jgi:hypothetical protein
MILTCSLGNSISESLQNLERYLTFYENYSLDADEELEQL